jgi:hypothetical protein
MRSALCEIRPGENVTLQYLSHDGSPGPPAVRAAATMRPTATAPSKRPIVTCSDGNGRPDRVSVGGRLAAIAAAICGRSFSLPDSISWNSSTMTPWTAATVASHRLALRF